MKGYASHHGNYGLIHSLCQAMEIQFPIVVDQGWIRQQLQERFPSSGAYPVTHSNFVDLRSHWEAAVGFILASARDQGSVLDTSFYAVSFQIVSVEGTARVIGDRVGSGPYVLHHLNHGFLHFVILIRLRRR